MKSLGAATLALPVVLLTAWPAAAQSAWTATPFLQSSAGIRHATAGNSAGLGVAIAHQWGAGIAFEGEVSHLLDVAGDRRAERWSLSNVSANAVYHFAVPRVVPYATVGVGVQRSSYRLRGSPAALSEEARAALRALGLDPAAPLFAPSYGAAVNVGGGARYAVSDRLIVRADLRRFVASGSAPSHWRLYGGMTFVVVGRTA